MNTNLKEISKFIKKNNSYSDFNLVDNFLLNLNFTKINFKKNLIKGGSNIDKNNCIGGGEPSQPSQEPSQEPSEPSQEPSQPLQEPSEPSQEPIQELTVWTIKKGTILYHGSSNKKSFNDNFFNIGQDKLINFFTPDFKLLLEQTDANMKFKPN